jgi:hypothetical protein
VGRGLPGINPSGRALGRWAAGGGWCWLMGGYWMTGVETREKTVEIE